MGNKSELKKYLTEIYNEIYESIKRHVESKYTNVGITNRVEYTTPLNTDPELNLALYSTIEFIDKSKDDDDRSYMGYLTINIIGQIINNGVIAVKIMNYKTIGRRTIKNGKYQKLDNVVSKILSFVDRQILYHIDRKRRKEILRKYIEEELRIYPSRVIIHDRIGKCYLETKDVSIDLSFSVYDHEIILEQICISRRDKQHAPELDLVLDVIRTIQMMS